MEFGNILTYSFQPNGFHSPIMYADSLWHKYIQEENYYFLPDPKYSLWEL